MTMMTKLLQRALSFTEKRGGGAGRKDGVRWAVAGMATLLSGQKLPALSMFGRGVMILERAWREKHPGFEGGIEGRVKAALAHYEDTHKNGKNRTLHVVGIPMIVGGAAGLLLAPAFRPAWWASAGLFTVGWQLNIAGHLLFEKNKPAFADDPLSFIVGPLWDAKQLVGKLGRKKRAAEAAA